MLPGANVQQMHFMLDIYLRTPASVTVGVCAFVAETALGALSCRLDKAKLYSR